FRRDPALVWEWYNWRRGLIAPCKPNPAHETLAEMERYFDDFTLITQNVDGLHVLAGNRHILELHGSIYRLRCTRGCRAPWEDRAADLAGIPPHCPDCGALARPDVVWFGESLPADAIDAAWQSARRAQLFLVAGTSAVVQPAASLPLIALDAGAYVVEINPEPTPLSAHVHESIRGPAGESLPAWWEEWRAG
ncbi:MAG TPA: NAD-dependent deacylase, partial [Anaerolineae bacterium]|nr:NAD-dependent deacylase [Anaerolineae bacterium]